MSVQQFPLLLNTAQASYNELNKLFRVISKERNHRGIIRTALGTTNLPELIRSNGFSQHLNHYLYYPDQPTGLLFFWTATNSQSSLNR